MLACLSALIVATPKAKVTIYTDSATTIDSFAKLDHFMQLSVCKKEKTPNFQLWMTIDYIIKALDLTVTMIKVKAHSGDPLNDRADQLAKTAALSTSRLNLIYTNLPGLSLTLTYDHLILETSSRRSVKQIYHAKYFY